MSHYEQQLAADRRKIDLAVEQVGEKVAAAQQAAIESVLSGDRRRAYRTILDDLSVNRRVRRIDHACHRFVARHLPSAGHLRWVSSVLRMSVALERIGDYAATVCRAAVQLTAAPPQQVARDLELLADRARRVFAQAMRAWSEGDPELARSTLGTAAEAAVASKRVFADLLASGERDERNTADLFALLTVFNRLERLVAQTKNICEETIFVATGETKAPKVYSILFVDEKNDCWSQLAVAQARKAFAAGCTYDSAGWSPAAGLEARCRAFMERQNLDTFDLEPRLLDAQRSSLGAHHVIVSLGGDLRAHVEGVPFQSVVLEWQVGPDLDGLDQERAESLLQAGLRDLSVRLTELVELLHGRESD